MSELWASARRQVHKAEIILGRPGTAIRCEVRNASKSGAMLRLNRTAEVPSAFTLQMPGGETRFCSVIRRSRIDISVRFDAT